MVQSVNSSNSGQNVVNRLLDSTAHLRAAATKPSKSALPPELPNAAPKPGVAPQKMLQNLIKMMGQLLETLKSMLTQFMQGLSGGALGSADSAAATAGAAQTDDASTSSTTDANTSPTPASSSSSANGVDSKSGEIKSGDVDPEPIDEEDLLPEEAATFRAAAKPSTQRDPLQALTDNKGLPTVITEDGYTIHCDADKASWSITGPDGKTTQIWGDPHVIESDNDKWDFKNQSTFKFGNNKVTVEVAPFGDGSTTVTSRITVYSGEQRVTIGGIDKAQARIEASANDGRTHDAALQDGDTYQRSLEPGRGDGEQWKKVAAVQ